MKKISKKTLISLKRLLLELYEIYFYIAGSKIQCNICQFKCNRFNSDRWHLYCTCPYCSSDVRERLLMASLSCLDDFSFEKIIRNKRILHFSPEQSLIKPIQKVANEYKTADFEVEGYSYDRIDYSIDISNMKIIANESFDCVIACDVLEHVQNHISGIREVHRILRKGGYCIFTVPQKDNLKVTFEDPTIIGKKERERLYGQADHLRIYGEDFIDILQSSGFKVTAVDKSFFDNKIVDRHVLFPPFLSKHPLATNYRKIFFGKKI